MCRDSNRKATLGMSMGCATSIYAAIQAPERVIGLILVIPPTAWETRDETQRGKMRQGADLIEERGIDTYLGAFASVSTSCSGF